MAWYQGVVYNYRILVGGGALLDHRGDNAPIHPNLLTLCTYLHYIMYLSPLCFHTFISCFASFQAYMFVMFDSFNQWLSLINKIKYTNTICATRRPKQWYLGTDTLLRTNIPYKNMYEISHKKNTPQLEYPARVRRSRGVSNRSGPDPYKQALHVIFL
jgi:hypothetical protein